MSGRPAQAKEGGERAAGVGGGGVVRWAGGGREGREKELEGGNKNAAGLQTTQIETLLSTKFSNLPGWKVSVGGEADG